MNRFAFLFLACWLFLPMGSAVAQELKVVNPPSTAIPFKTNPTPFEEHGSRVASVLLLFVIVSGCAIYLIRKKNLHLPDFIPKYKHVKIIESVKLNSKSTLYVIEFGQRKLLIGQSGDNIVCLSDIAAGKTSK